ncbi:MAG: hypothetical protein IKI23_11355 [Lachnospiraceae bacterium]|jgi:hypothetical protein|nr:hypothetical protein [Lachnospiraceae bacterium]
MQIEFKEKHSEDYFREGVNVQVQYQVIQKKPEGKLKDYFTLTKRYLIILIATAAVLVLVNIFTGFSGMSIFALIFLGVVALLDIRYSQTMNKLLEGYLKETRHSTFKADSQGIRLERGGAAAASLNWSEVSFVRVFEHCILFAGTKAPGPFILVPVSCREEIFSFMDQNGIKVRTIGR